MTIATDICNDIRMDRCDIIDGITICRNICHQKYYVWLHAYKICSFLKTDENYFDHYEIKSMTMFPWMFPYLSTQFRMYNLASASVLVGKFKMLCKSN